MKEEGAYEHIPESELKMAMEEVFDYSVSLVFKNRLAGSGTLASVGSHFGIITAKHVADVLFKDKREEVFICFTKQMHSVHRTHHCFQRIIVGAGNDDEFGPDLEFIEILDPTLIETLKQRKSFYPINEQNNISLEGSLNYLEMSWLIAGVPEEMREVLPPNHSSPESLKFTHFIGQVVPLTYTRRSDFDFVALQVDSGISGFPQSYGGVSGGGAWVLCLIIDPSIGLKSKRHAPFLAGVAYHQSPLASDNTRIITCHGPGSIFRNLFQKLNEA